MTMQFDSADELFAHYVAIRKRLYARKQLLPPKGPMPPLPLRQRGRTIYTSSLKRPVDRPHLRSQRAIMDARIANAKTEGEAARLRAQAAIAAVETIKEVVAREYAVTVLDIESDQRTKGIVFPRQIAMWLAHKMTPNSYPKIGECFGYRDHTTVLHAIRKMERLAAADSAFAARLHELEHLVREAS